MKDVRPAKAHKVLVIDTGGTNIKLLVSGQKEPRKIPSGPAMTAVGGVGSAAEDR